VWLPPIVAEDGKETQTATLALPGVARAAAQSMVLFGCDSGFAGCSGDSPGAFILCADFISEFDSEETAGISTVTSSPPSTAGSALRNRTEDAGSTEPASTLSPIHTPTKEPFVFKGSPSADNDAMRVPVEWPSSTVASSPSGEVLSVSTQLPPKQSHDIDVDVDRESGNQRRISTCTLPSGNGYRRTKGKKVCFYQAQLFLVAILPLCLLPLLFCSVCIRFFWGGGVFFFVT
jgi:hypothetical protein